MTTLYIKLAAATVLLALTYFCYHLIQKNAETQQLLEQANSALEIVGQAKAKSEKAQLDLKKQVDVLNSRTQEVITQIIKEPVTASEKCISPVLLRALIDEETAK